MSVTTIRLPYLRAASTDGEPACRDSRRPHIRKKSALTFSALLLSTTLLSGCASMGPSGVRPDGLTLTDISVMLEAQQPQADIAKAITLRGLAAQAKPEDVEVLEKKGAKSEVIDAVLTASWDDSNDARQAWSYGASPYYSDPFWSPWPWGFGMSYGWGGGHFRPGFWSGAARRSPMDRSASPTPPPIRQGGAQRSPGFGTPKLPTPRR